MQPFSLRWEEAAYVTSGFRPNPLQQEIIDWWRSSNSRFVQILGGERSGKSQLAAFLAFLSCSPADNNRKKTYWIVGPDYNQPRAEWTYLYEWFDRAKLVDGSPSMPQGISASWRFETVLGQQFLTRSSSDIMKLASFSVDGVLMAEAAQQLWEVYLKLMGRVSETGGFLIMSGTLEDGLPWYEDIFERWQGANQLGARSFSMPTWSNLAIYPGGRDDPAIKELEAEYPEDLFMQRFGGKPRGELGRVVPEFDIQVHVRDLQVDPDAPVQMWIDPGQHCYAVLFVQCLGLYTHVLDRIYMRNMIAQDIIPMAMGNPLFKRVNLSAGGVIDIAGKQRHANKSQVMLWQEIAGVTLQSQYIHMDDLISTLRYRLRADNPRHEPLVYFNSHMTNSRTYDNLALDVLAEFYLWKWPKRTVRQNEAIKPVDRNNDAMKALGYGLINQYGIHIERRSRARVKNRSYYI